MEINKDYIVQSLLNQITVLTMQVAERDALITEQEIELKSLREGLYGKKEEVDAS